MSLRCLRPALAACAFLLVGGCASTRPWVNAPLAADGGAARTATLDAARRDPSTLVAVTLSGGGARAAAFGYGVLRELRDTPCCWNDRGSNLLDAVDVVSGVSGGSIVAAYLAAFGAEGLERFESEFLRQDVQDGLLGSLFDVGNLFELTSPWFGRSELLVRRLDALYRGRTFADVARRPRHPQLVVTATDLSLGAGFEFTAAQFELICSELGSVPLAVAVAASSAVPLLLTPITLRNHRADCPLPPAAWTTAAAVPTKAPATGDFRSRLLRAQATSYLDAARRPYIHLVDGGLSDNLGVRRLLEHALAGGDLRSSFAEVRIPPGSVRRLVLVSVNAERDPAHRIDTSDRVPSTLDVVDALLFGAGSRATVETQEWLADVARLWRDTLQSGGGERLLSAFAPDAEIHLIEVNLRDAPNDAARPLLLQVPTALSIGDAEVTSLVEAGRSVLRRSSGFRALRRSLEDAAAAPKAGPR